MNARTRAVALWLIGIAAAAVIVARATYVADLSAFLPAKPTALQAVLIDQLRDGPASRLVLIALEGGDAAHRAATSAALADRLRKDAQFSNVGNGDSPTADRDRDYLFRHRYVLSDDITADRFTAAGLRAAIGDTVQDLAGSTGALLKDLLPHDPTGEMLHIIDTLARTRQPRNVDGVWTSPDGTRALLIAQVAAPGSDTDAAQRALDAIRAGFDAVASPSVRLRMSGPPVFAVAARAKIKQAVTRLSIASSFLVIAVLLAIYRSAAALLLGLLPVATGAVCGIAAVALGFSVVHGVTLGFGVTLIGEAVDYSIYFFIHSRDLDSSGSSADGWRRKLWPTIRLGMLTSVCGFASLLPSGFPGLAQLGVYSISGLVAAALVTRFVLPELKPAGLSVRDLAPLGAWLGRARDALRGIGPRAIAIAAGLLGVAALTVLSVRHASLWNHELSALSPVSASDLEYDARLRADLGTTDVPDLVVVSGASLQAVLQGAERAAPVLRALVDAGVLGDFESPADYLPSLAMQDRRRAALPAADALAAALHAAAPDLNVEESRLAPFVQDVDAARHSAPLTRADLTGTTLAAGFDALILHHAGRFTAILPLHSANPALPTVDVARVNAALAAAQLADTRVLDLKSETDGLYESYLREAIALSLCGLALIAALLLITLRSALRAARVLAPLGLAVLTVAAGLVLAGQRLNLLHLVGMLLIVAVGSNYALFFDRETRRETDGEDADHASSLTLASLGVANLCTALGFGLLSFSGVPVLEALGETVAPGAVLALLFAALLTSPSPPAPAAGGRVLHA